MEEVEAAYGKQRFEQIKVAMSRKRLPRKRE